MKSRVFILTASILFCFLSASSQQLVYKPVNPAFGGDTFNYQWLLSSAQAQNKLEDLTRTPFGANPLDDFENNLKRQILNQLSREIINKMFGEEGLQDGSFEFGVFEVTITSQLEGIDIEIHNSRDGSKTNITVPYY
ncbi:MAG TPA: curli assembly protein CsgF [Chryseosolibacter sp.]